MKQRNLQMKKTNCKLHSHHLDPVQRGNVKKIFFLLGELVWMLPLAPSPLHCKTLGLWVTGRSGFFS